MEPVLIFRSDHLLYINQQAIIFWGLDDALIGCHINEVLSSEDIKSFSQAHRPDGELNSKKVNISNPHGNFSCIAEFSQEMGYLWVFLRAVQDTQHCHPAKDIPPSAYFNTTGFWPSNSSNAQSFDDQRMFKLLHEAEQMANMGSWEANLFTDELIWSKETCRLFGYAPNDFPGKVDSFIELIHPEDRAKIRAKHDGSRDTGELEAEYRIYRHGDGKLRWMYERGRIIYDNSGREIRRLGMVTDITEKKRLEQVRTLEAKVLNSVTSGARFTEILNEVTLGIEAILPESKASILLLDNSGQHLVKGAAPSLPEAYNNAIDGERVGNFAGSCGTAAYRKQMIIVEDIETDPLWKNYKSVALAHGLRACWSMPVFNDKHQVIATFAIYHHEIKTPENSDLDTIERIARIISLITMKNINDEKMLESEQRFRRIFKEAAIGIAITECNGRFLEANQTYCDMLGYTLEELQKTEFSSLTHPDDRMRNMAEIRDILAGIRESSIINKRYLKKTGDIVWARLSVSVHRDNSGRPLHLIAIAEDVTEMHMAAQRESDIERSLMLLLKNLPGVAYRGLNDSNWTMRYLSDAFVSLTGYEREDVLDNHKISFVELIHPDDREYVATQAKAGIESTNRFQVEYRIKCQDGSEKWVWEQGTVADEEKKLIEGYITDITQQKLASTAIKQSEHRFHLLSKATNDAIWDWDIKANSLWWNEGFAEQFGLVNETHPPSIALWSSRIHPEERKSILDRLEETLTLREPNWSAQYRFLKSNNDYAIVNDRGYIIYDDTGKAIRMVCGMSDISEKLTLEEQLRQSQRLESVGKLTGGLAHDFNNLLTVIIGNASVMTETEKDNATGRQAEMILHAAKRGADLTSNLLAFARKQPMKLSRVNVNRLLTRAEPLISSAAGENIDLELRLTDFDQLVELDESQFENAIINMVINARDAMPKGGQIQIESSCIFLNKKRAALFNLSLGDYVVISISDTGTGISESELQHVFEPFFTTKPVGEGTGLGLAMVYGFIKQSKGHITVESSIGKGTTLTIYLPVETEKIAEPDLVPSIQSAPAYLNDSALYEKTILLVEDDNLVNHFVTEQLAEIGFNVIAMDNAQSALTYLEAGNHVDLLFTDAVMPGDISGIELVKIVRDRWPRIKTLVTSGYSESLMPDFETPGSQVNVLSKPYEPSQLKKVIFNIVSKNKN
jgi:PAS domain S-box-containing protein